MSDLKDIEKTLSDALDKKEIKITKFDEYDRFISESNINKNERKAVRKLLINVEYKIKSGGGSVE